MGLEAREPIYIAFEIRLTAEERMAGAQNMIETILMLIFQLKYLEHIKESFN